MGKLRREQKKKKTLNKQISRTKRKDTIVKTSGRYDSNRSGGNAPVTSANTTSAERNTRTIIDDSRKQQSQLVQVQRGSGGKPARKISVSLSENLRVSDIARTRKAVRIEIERQKKVELDERLSILAGEKRIADINSSPLPEKQFVRYGAGGRAVYSYGNQDNASKDRGKKTGVIKKSNEQIQSRVNQRQHIVNELEKQIVEIKQEDFIKLQTDFSQGDSPVKRKLPPKPASALVGGGAVMFGSQNSQGTKFIESVSGKGKQHKVELTESLAISEGQKSPKQLRNEKWLPKYFETGKARFTNEGLGSDYFGGKQPKSKTSGVKFGGVAIEAEQGISNENRGIKGAMALPENLYSLAVGGGKAVASDVSKMQIGSFDAPHLKKDIVITPIEIVTSGQDIPKGFSDLGKDFAKDTPYWLGNVGANVMAGAVSFGVAPAYKAISSGVKNIQSKNKAKATLDYIFPAKLETVGYWKPTGKTAKTQSGLEVTQFKQSKKKVPQTETFDVVSSKQGDNIKLAGAELTGEIKTQKVSPIESFDKVGQQYGFDVYSFGFKDGGRFQKGKITMTPDPVIEMFETAKGSPRKSKPTERVLQLDKETGQKIQAEINLNPSQSEQIFSKYALKGTGGEYIQKSTLPKDFYLADLETAKISKVSEQTARFEGSRGKEVLQSEQFTFSELYGKMKDVKDPQLMNLFQQGKVKDVGAKSFQKSRYSIDELLYAPEQAGSPSFADIGIPKKSKFGFKKDKTPDITPKTSSKEVDYLSLGDSAPQFEKITAIEYDLLGKRPDLFDLPFYEKSGKLKVKGQATGGKPMKPFAPDVADTQLVTKKMEKQMFADFMGQGFEPKASQATTSKSAVIPTGTPFSSDAEQKLVFPTESKLDDIFGLNAFVGEKIKSKGKQDIGLGVLAKPDSKIDSGFGIGEKAFWDFDVKTSPLVATKQSQKQTPIVEQTPIVDSIFDVPIITETTFAPSPPTTPKQPPFPPFIDAPFFDLAFGDEFEQKKGKGKKQPRYWNADPDNVLNFFPSRLGYQKKEFKQIKSRKKKGKKKKNSNMDFGGYDTIGFSIE